MTSIRQRISTPHPGRFIGKYFIKPATLNLKRSAHAAGKLVFKSKLRVLIPLYEGSAVFKLKACINDGIHYAGLLDEFNTLRQ